MKPEGFVTITTFTIFKPQGALQAFRGAPHTSQTLAAPLKFKIRPPSLQEPNLGDCIAAFPLSPALKGSGGALHELEVSAHQFK